MSSVDNPSRVAVLGASRGLGAAVVQELKRRYPACQIMGLARKSGQESIQWVNADVSQPEEQLRVLNRLMAFQPQKIVCTLGGGPYGLYQQKAWRDHQWCLEVSFLFPARLIHWALNEAGNVLNQLVVVGSSVAESKPDPHAASYAAAKHALCGLVQTIQSEKPKLDIRLFSPGYMNTDLLPSGAAARQKSVWNPRDVAGELVHWMESGAPNDHRRLAVWPGDR